MDVRGTRRRHGSGWQAEDGSRAGPHVKRRFRHVAHRSSLPRAVLGPVRLLAAGDPPLPSGGDDRAFKPRGVRSGDDVRLQGERRRRAQVGVCGGACQRMAGRPAGGGDPSRAAGEGFDHRPGEAGKDGRGRGVPQCGRRSPRPRRRDRVFVERRCRHRHGRRGAFRHGLLPGIPADDVGGNTPGRHRCPRRSDERHAAGTLHRQRGLRRHLPCPHPQSLRQGDGRHGDRATDAPPGHRSGAEDPAAGADRRGRHDVCDRSPRGASSPAVVRGAGLPGCRVPAECRKGDPRPATQGDERFLRG